MTFKCIQATKLTCKLILNKFAFEALPRQAFVALPQLTRPMSTNSNQPTNNQIRVKHPLDHVAHIELSNSKTKNSLTIDGAKQLCDELLKLEEDSTVRCIVLTGDGRDLTSGIDLKSFAKAYQSINEIQDPARRAKFTLGIIKAYQEPFKVMSESVSKPIICCIHGHCYGLGMELAASSDIRYCSQDAIMSVREVLISIAADVGSLQKLPKLFANQSLLREFIYTGKDIPVDVALSNGFVSKIFKDKQETIDEAFNLAKTIALKSPVAVQGSKINLRFSENKSFLDGLDYNAVWNMSMLQSEDVVKAVMGILSKEDKVQFEDY